MSRFVSGGTNDAPTERDEAWIQAQHELETKRAQAAEASKQDGGKSLYETLQANKGDSAPGYKAAKQEAFEEAARLKNQFRSLDEDEVAFLDEVLDGERKKEAEVRSQTKKDLEGFRKLQEEAERSAAAETGQDEEETVDTQTWKTGTRKRKKGREAGLVGGVKIRRTSSATAEKKVETEAQTVDEDTLAKTAESKVDNDAAELSTRQLPSGDPAIKTAILKAPVSPPTASPTAAGGLGLAAYSSSDEDG